MGGPWLLGEAGLGRLLELFSNGYRVISSIRSAAPRRDRARCPDAPWAAKPPSITPPPSPMRSASITFHHHRQFAGHGGPRGYDLIAKLGGRRHCGPAEQHHHQQRDGAEGARANKLLSSYDGTHTSIVPLMQGLAARQEVVTDALVDLHKEATRLGAMHAFTALGEINTRRVRVRSPTAVGPCAESGTAAKFHHVGREQYLRRAIAWPRARSAVADMNFIGWPRPDRPARDSCRRWSTISSSSGRTSGHEIETDTAVLLPRVEALRMRFKRSAWCCE